MRRASCTVVLAALLTLAGSASVRAETDPVGGCPDRFRPHLAMDHDHEHEHQHVGSDTDRNGDGWICVKHVSADGSIHLHIDNTRPLR